MSQIITTGFYYHYKHDSSLGAEHYAYEVLNFGLHTEIDSEEDAKMVIYRPLYQSARVYQMGRLWDIRPFAMFAEQVEVAGVVKNRFEKISDSETIAYLETVKAKMYS